MLQPIHMNKYYLIICYLLTILGCSTQETQREMNFDNKFELALEAMETKDYARAETILLKLDQAFPEAVGVKMNLSVIAEENGDIEKAIEYLEEALKFAPDHPRILMLLGELTGNQNYSDKSQKLRDKVIKVDSRCYFEHFKENNPIVNTEYSNFDIKMTGEVVAIDTAKRIVYLRGEDTDINASVACQNSHLIIDKIAIGDVIEFIGISFGIGADISAPIIVYKKDFRVLK